MAERILSGRYVLNEPIGAGGMAVVYRAWDRVELREVAVKVLRPEYNEDADFIRRFNLEAQAASKMSHPNIVGIYGVGQDDDMRYIVMEYVKGRTLKELIRQSGRIKPHRAVQMTLRILAAVDHAHKSHVIHRDIKPQNILVDTEGNVKVADFGIARATNSNTQTYMDGGNVLGSVHYLSPEQASGQIADEKSDLYSVGVVLYEMVTGVVPFDGDNPVSVALKHVQEPPRSAREIEPEISKGLDEVILKSLDKESSCRYQSAADFANDLKKAIRMPKGGFVDLLPSSGARIRQKLGREENRKRIQIWLVTAAALLVVAAAIYYGNSVYRDLFVRMKLPNLIMLDVEDAVSRLEGMGLAYNLEQRHSDEVKMGFVIEQYPEGNSFVWPGDRIQMVVSIGKETLMMPKLLDLTRSEAVRLLEENDLVLGNVTLEISSSQPGTVIAQEPGINEWVKPGDKVNICVSGESATVPDMRGFTLEEAKSMLIASGFTLGEVVKELSDRELGEVLAQSAPPDTLALMGMSIDLTVSQPPPVSYGAQTSVVVKVPEGGAEIYCTLEESGGEREIYRETLPAGSQTIRLDMSTQEKGMHVVSLYLSGELAAEKEIDFQEEIE